MITERAELRAEIEGLREEVAILRTSEAADNERLRAALETIAQSAPQNLDAAMLREIARRALEPKK